METIIEIGLIIWFIILVPPIIIGMIIEIIKAVIEFYKDLFK